MAQLIYDGRMFSGHYRDLSYYVASTQRHVTGTVRMRLLKGQAVAVGRRSPQSLYDFGLATYETGDQFDHDAAVSFIKLFSQGLRTQARVQLGAGSSSEIRRLVAPTHRRSRAVGVSALCGAVASRSRSTSAPCATRRRCRSTGGCSSGTCWAASRTRACWVASASSRREDAATLVDGLSQILRTPPPLDGAFEDIHSLVEAELAQRVGQPAGRLHTARSRNDQVATDARLFCRAALIEGVAGIVGAAGGAARGGAAAYAHASCPGYTHLQRAQPVNLAHHLLAYWEMLERDAARLRDCYSRADVLPLGAGALAGSPYPLDREYVARLLGSRTSAATAWTR